MDIILPAVLNGLSDKMRDYADDLENQAKENQGRIDETLIVQKQQKNINAACQALGDLILSGMPLEKAAERVASRFKVGSAQLKIIWPTFSRKIRKKAAIERERRIMIMYRAALSDKVIAKREGVSDRHIRRVIKERLDDLTSITQNATF